jgi:putative lipoprotein
VRGGPDRGTIARIAEEVGMATSGQLAGTSWRLVRVGRRVPLEGHAVSATFGPEGSVSGSAGCNRYMGSYTTAGAGLAITPLATTRMACRPDVDAQELRFLTALQASTRWAVSGGRLKLTGGAVSLTFEGV